MDHERSLKQLKEALQAHNKALENLESTLVEFEHDEAIGEAWKDAVKEAELKRSRFLETARSELGLPELEEDKRKLLIE